MGQRLLILFFLLPFTFFPKKSYARGLKFTYAYGISTQDKKTLDRAMEEVAQILPEKLKARLPESFEIRVEKLSSHKSLPTDLCEVADPKAKKKGPFIYGEYNTIKDVLTINRPVVKELEKGLLASTKITCQHKSLYSQAIATIAHELVHAYDANADYPSSSAEYMAVSNFKAGVFSLKNKNLNPMRSADNYETKNVAESFAVNAEYFMMDPEFFCRKPTTFNYFKNLFQVDPFPKRDCRPGNTVMLSTSQGFFPIDLDPARVYRIEYLLASPGKGIQSGFGHTMLRLVMCAPEHFDTFFSKTVPATPFGEQCLKDKLYHLVVSYRANVMDSKLNYLKGLMGGYPSILFILSFADVLDEYNKDELRDLESYPLTLTPKEKERLIWKIKEENWNYQGSYKFITNNCAVETYDLLKSAFTRIDLGTLSSVTPVGVLKDLEKFQILSSKDPGVSIYEAKYKTILNAYRDAYGYKIKKKTADNKKALEDFIYESSSEDRMKTFKKFKRKSMRESDEKKRLHYLDKRQKVAASFSNLEQQILRAKSLDYRKELAEMLMDEKLQDEVIMKVRRIIPDYAPKKFHELFKSGYGIPMSDEIMTEAEVKTQSDNAENLIEEGKKILAELMPEASLDLNNMEKAIKTFNKYSFNLRKTYLEELVPYIDQSLRRLALDDSTRALLTEAANGDKASLNKVRELLGETLVNEKEILDSKLQKWIRAKLGT